MINEYNSRKYAKARIHGCNQFVALYYPYILNIAHIYSTRFPLEPDLQSVKKDSISCPWRGLVCLDKAS